MKIQCPKCFLEYEADQSCIGKTIECQCGYQWTALPEVKKTKKCPMCGEEILAEAKKCRFCGEYLTADNKPLQQKDRLIYTILGIFLGNLGVHNFYAGQYLAAMVKIVFFILTVVVFAACEIHEPTWIFPAAVNLYFVIWDLCYDPNIPTGKRNKICGLAPWIVSFAALFLFLGFMIFVSSQLKN